MWVFSEIESKDKVNEMPNRQMVDSYPPYHNNPYVPSIRPNGFHQLSNEQFFIDFQKEIYEKYGYALDKLTPSKDFWSLNKCSGQLEYSKVFSHLYYLHYAKRFTETRRDVKKVLEIGVWCGFSMLLWERFFPNAQIYGIDISLNTKHNNRTPVELCKGKDRITLVEMDGTSPSESKKFIEKFGGDYDIIIDDGSHHPLHQVLSLLIYLPYLKDTGTFVVEDIVANHPSQITKLIRMEERYNLFKKTPFYYLEEFFNTYRERPLKDFGITKKLNLSLLDEYSIDIKPAQKYKVNFQNMDLEKRNVSMNCLNDYEMCFLTKKIKK